MSNDTILLLGGTGKTARRIAPLLRAAGAKVRTAARRGADVVFDWDDPTSWGPALSGVGVVYVVPPSGRLDYPPVVTAFVDRAEAAGVHHVTFLAARGVDQLPPEAPPRAVELDLAARSSLTHSVVRPGWFLHNFSEGWLRPVGGRIAAPTGDGAEAFVHADDIAEVAAATLLHPEDHDGAGYTLAGPEALTFGDIAAGITAATGLPVVHDDVTREAWVAQQVAGGLPQDYAELLGGLLDERVRNGVSAAGTPDIEKVTGHAPRSFADYAADPAVVEAWRQAVAQTD
ncbi:MAG TPA: NAD(P)H-binding protein [Acidimicrobiales bacterium]